jgi:hypothetical protein
MKRLINTLICVISLPTLLIAASVDDSRKSAMYNELDFIKSVFESKYAPTEWKRAYFGWDLEKEVETAKAHIAKINPITLKDYQREVLRLLNSTKDYHVQTLFCSTEAAFLPFGVKRASGKYLITQLLTDEEGKPPFGLAVGDELVAFDGLPVAEAIAELKRISYDDNTEETDQIYAEVFLTNRMGFTGLPVPQGLVSFTIRPRGTNELKTYECEWIYEPEIVEAFQEDYPQPVKSLSKKEQLLAAANREMVLPSYEKMHQLMEDDLSLIGAKKSNLPPLGSQLWETTEDCPFYGYIFDQDGRNIGYIRIPTYSAGEEEAEIFGELINFFEQNTDALVIDQLNNPGGVVYYAYALLSMLADRPLELPLHQFALTQEDVLHSYKLINLLESLEALLERSPEEFADETLAGYPFDASLLRSMKSHHQFVLSQWQAKQRLTAHTHMDGIEQIMPSSKGSYSKPILFLINNLDFSCGDLVPAILQDNQRATIFGTRTAGAGGIVHKFAYPNLSGIEKISMTTSILLRTNNNPIENLGVQPDLPYEVTENDILNGYEGYKAKVGEALQGMLK